MYNEFKDIPLGLGMALAVNDHAMQTYSNLKLEQKNEIISYIQGAQSGAEAKQRVKEVVTKLKTNSYGA